MNRKKIAKCVSAITQAPIVALILLSIIYASHAFVSQVSMVLGVIFLTVIPILRIFTWSKYIGETHGNISNKSDRLVPYIVSIISYFIYWVILICLNSDKVLTFVAVSYSIGTLVLFIINMWCKVSAHASGVAIACSLLICIFGIYGLISLLILPVVLWSRFTLKKHTWSQLILGMCTGFVVPICIYTIAVFL